jgi:hypothetical protein
LKLGKDEQKQLRESSAEPESPQPFWPYLKNTVSTTLTHPINQPYSEKGVI